MSKSAAALQSAVLDYEHLTSEIVWAMQHGHGIWHDTNQVLRNLNDERLHAIRRMVRNATVVLE